MQNQPPDENRQKQELIPELCLTDSSLESGWSFSDGWNGLIPGQSRHVEVIERLGPSCGASELANAITYDFMDGGVRATFLDGEEAISLITLYPEKLSRLVPSEIAEAYAAFGNFAITKMGPREGAVYERPGMRIHAEASTPEQRIRSIEIFRPDE